MISQSPAKREESPFPRPRASVIAHNRVLLPRKAAADRLGEHLDRGPVSVLVHKHKDAPAEFLRRERVATLPQHFERLKARGRDL